MRPHKLIIAALSVPLLLGTVGAKPAPPAPPGPTVVTITGDTAAAENDPGGWMFNRDASTSTPFAFDLEQARIGTGSAHILPIGAAPADKFIAEHFVQALMADVESISYDFLIGAGGTAADENEFYLNVYANFGTSDPLKFYDCRYNIVPTTGSTMAWTTVTFDPTLPYAVTTRGGASASPFPCPASPAAMEGLSAGSSIRVIAMNVGDTSAGDLGLDGYYDNVVEIIGGTTTVYDFEATADACKQGAWASYGFKNQGQCVRYVQTGVDSR